MPAHAVSIASMPTAWSVFCSGRSALDSTRTREGWKPIRPHSGHRISCNPLLRRRPRCHTHGPDNSWIVSSRGFVTGGAVDPTLTLALRADDRLDEALRQGLQANLHAEVRASRTRQ